MVPRAAALGEPALADGVYVNSQSPPSPGLSDDEHRNQASGKVHHGRNQLIATLVPVANSAVVDYSGERPSGPANRTVFTLTVRVNTAIQLR